MKNETFPNEIAKAQKLQHLATWNTLLGDVLYENSYSMLHSDPYLRCLGPNEAW